MEVGVKVIVEHFSSKESKHILSAYLTFVALDEKGSPTQVPELVPETPIEQRRHQEAGERRVLRQKEKEERLLRRQHKS